MSGHEIRCLVLAQVLALSCDQKPSKKRTQEAQWVACWWWARWLLFEAPRTEPILVPRIMRASSCADSSSRHAFDSL